ncbi:tape measure protein [Caldifermentibacillus hisashii]|uniref:tape measure protein n=1 Tax=Caldifermentibacillus hisashii TaxID=996558 RepID=UPI0031FDFE3D
MFKAIAGSAVVIGAFNGIRNSVDGAISRFDTLQTFPNVMQMMGFSATDSEKAIKRLADGIDGLPTALDEVTGTAQRLATMTGDLDGAVETTLALNNAFLASGASSADASRGLEQYVQMLATGTVDLQSWRTLQETMPIALNKVAEAFGYTGRSAQNDLYEALKAGEITFDEFNSKIVELSNTTGGFAELARESSTGIRTSWQNVKTAVVKGVADMIGSIDEALSSFGGISGVLDRFKEGVKTAFGFVNSMIPVAINLFREVYNAIKPWLPLIASVVTAFLTFNIVVGTVNSVKSAVMGLRAGIALLNATLLANPVALVIAVLAGLAVMFVHLWNTSESFRQKVTEVFQAFLDFVMPIVQRVVDFVMQVWGGLVEWWSQNGQTILTTAQNVWNTVSSVVSTVINEVVSFVMSIWSGLVAFWQEHGQMILQAAENVWSVVSSVIETAINFISKVIEAGAKVIQAIMEFLWPFIETLVKTTWEAIKGIIQGAIDIITGIIQFFSALFTGDWTALWDSIKQILSGAVEFIWNFIQVSFIGRILKAVQTFAKNFINVIKSKWDTVKNVFSTSINFVEGIVTSGFNAIKNVINTVLNFIRGIVNTVWNGISNTISTIVNNIKNTISNIFNSLKDIVSKAFNNVKDAVKEGMDKAYTAVTDKISDFFNAGRNIVTSIADGIKSAVGIVTDAISGVTQKIRDFLPFSPAKEGALRDIMNIQIAESIAKSIDKGRRTAVTAMAGLTNAIYGEMPQMDIAGTIGRLKVNRAYAGNNNAINARSNGITQNITIVSPEPTSPSENARKFKQVARQLALEW